MIADELFVYPEEASCEQKKMAFCEYYFEENSAGKDLLRIEDAVELYLFLFGTYPILDVTKPKKRQKT